MKFRDITIAAWIASAYVSNSSFIWDEWLLWIVIFLSVLLGLYIATRIDNELS